jgi:hypothetical protein
MNLHKVRRLKVTRRSIEDDFIKRENEIKINFQQEISKLKKFH